jgi:hypothetical protein
MKEKMQCEYCGGGGLMNSKPEVLEIAELSAIFLLCRLQEQP